MRNGPVLWANILEAARGVDGVNPIIAGGAVRDYVLKLGEPKDIDVFLGGSPPDDMQLGEEWHPRDPRARDEIAQPEYQGQIGTITAIQDWNYDPSERPVQFIWIGDNDPVRYVRGFDLGTSKCYYRGSLVLGKDFLDDWHHQRITILESAFERPRNIDRSRERARLLAARYPNGATIVERPGVVIRGPALLPIMGQDLPHLVRAAAEDQEDAINQAWFNDGNIDWFLLPRR